MKPCCHRNALACVAAGKKESHHRREVRVLFDGIQCHADDLASAVCRQAHTGISAQSAQIHDATVSVPEHSAELREIGKRIDQAVFRKARDESVLA